MDDNRKMKMAEAIYADDLCAVLFLEVLIHMQEMLGALLTKDTKRLTEVLEDFAEDMRVLRFSCFNIFHHWGREEVKEEEEEDEALDYGKDNPNDLFVFIRTFDCLSENPYWSLTPAWVENPDPGILRDIVLETLKESSTIVVTACREDERAAKANPRHLMAIEIVHMMERPTFIQLIYLVNLFDRRWMEKYREMYNPEMAIYEVIKNRWRNLSL